MPYVPEEVIEYLDRNPGATGADIYDKGLASSPRSARRYRLYYDQGVASPALTARITSAFMQTWEPDLEEDDFDLDEFFEVAARQTETALIDDPILTIDEFTFPDATAVLFGSCMHLGGRYTNYRKVRDLFNAFLETPGIYWGSLGDDIEGFMAQFRDRKAVYDQILPLPRQLQVLDHILNKLDKSDKLLFGMSSQHGGQWMRRDTGTDEVKQLYLKYRVPYFDGMAYCKFHVGPQTYNVAMAHKFDGNSQYNPSHPQMKALITKFPNADVVVMGDRHHPVYQRLPMYGYEYQAGNRKSPMVTLLQAGTAKDGPDPYTIERWTQGIFEWPIVVFHANEHKVTVVESLSKVEDELDESGMD